MCVPAVLVGLDQRLGLGVPEVGICNGLMELLRAFRRELLEGPVIEAVVGPRRPKGDTQKSESLIPLQYSQGEGG